MTVRSLGLVLVLALTAFACSERDSQQTLDEPAVVAAPKKASKPAPTPATDNPASPEPATNTPATDTPATTTETDKATTPATTPATDANKPANDPAPAGNANPGAAVGLLQACLAGCGDDKDCAQTCVTDLAAGAGLPLPGGG